MKKNPALLFGAFVAALVIGAFLLNKKSPTKESIPFDDEPSAPVSSRKKPDAPKPPPGKPTITQSPVVKTDQDSLHQMATVLFEFTQEDRSLQDLLTSLEQAGQKPYTMRDRNEYTGEMTIVRTKNPFPGTRYFHAQYFGDKDNEAMAQHMSFEYKPGPRALNDAITAVEKSFPDLGEPTMRKENFVQWDLDDGYVVWVKKMSAEDLKDDPFNKYSAEDEGSIRVAVELNPEQE